MKAVTLIVFLLLISSFAASDKCRILSFSSGVDKVPYQVGALKAIIENLGAEDVQYDIVSGVSFGALNAAIAAVHPKGDEKAMIEELLNIWNNTKDITAYQDWWLGPAQGAIYKGGLWDNTPWKAYLTKVLKGRDPARNMTLGAVNVASGVYTELSELMTKGDLPDAVFAASALNVYFPPVNAFNQTWMDGAGVWPIDVIGPIRRCVQMGFKESDIVVDVMMTTSDTLAPRAATNDTAIPSAIRYFEIANFYSGINGLARAVAGFKTTNFRYCVNPGENPLPSSWFPFSFVQSEATTLIQRGYDDAMKIINNPQIKSCHQVVHNAKGKKAPKPPKAVEKFIRGEFE